LALKLGAVSPKRKLIVEQFND